MVEEQKLFKAPEEKKREEKLVEEKLPEGVEEKKKAEEVKELKAGEAKEAAKPAPAPTPAAKKEEKKEAKKEEKKEKKEEKKEEKKREVVLQRIYSVSLLVAYSKPRMHRANTAVKTLREFAARHMKTPFAKTKVDERVNSAIRKRGSGTPLKKIRVLASKDKEGIVLIEPA